MALETVGVRAVVEGFNDYISKTGKMEKSTGGLGSALSSMGKIAGGFVMAQGIMGAPGLFMDMAQAAADDAASVAKLQQAVENSGGSWDQYKGTLNGVIEAAQKRGFTDDQARDALSLLTAQTGSAEEAAKRFAMAQDLARGANIDVVTASKLLGKATEENVNVLSRYGIVAKEGMSETELFGMVQAKFGGQAEVFAKSTAGAMEAAKIEMSELKEKIGYAVLPVLTCLTKLVAQDLVPAISSFVDVAGPKIKGVVVPAFAALKDALAFLTKHRAETVAALIGIGAAITTVMIPAVIAWTVAEAAKTVALLASAAAFVVANAPLIAIAAAIALVVASVVLLIQHWDDITAKVPILKTAIKGVTDFFTGTVVPVVGTVVDALKGVITFVTDNWQTIAVLISGPFAPLVLLATDMFGVRSALTGAISAVIAWIPPVWDTVKGIVTAPFDLIVETAKDLWGVKTAITDAFDAAKKFVTDNWPEIAAIISGPFFPLVALATDAFGVRSALEGAMTNLKQFVSDRVDDITGFFTGLPGRITDTISNILSAATSVGASIKDGIIAGIKGAGGLAEDLASALVTALKDFINTQVIDRINDLLEIKLDNPLGKDIVINPPDIPHLAQGAIITRPTLALLAERGPEAVIPLSRIADRVPPRWISPGQAALGGGGMTINNSPTFLTPAQEMVRQYERAFRNLAFSLRRP